MSVSGRYGELGSCHTVQSACGSHCFTISQELWTSKANTTTPDPCPRPTSVSSWCAWLLFLRNVSALPWQQATPRDSPRH